MKGDYHVLPVNDLVDHEETRTCWCKPRLEARCEDCDGSGCWKCRDGFRPARADEIGRQLVIHDAADGRE